MGQKSVVYLNLLIFQSWHDSEPVLPLADNARLLTLRVQPEPSLPVLPITIPYTIVATPFHIIPIILFYKNPLILSIFTYNIHLLTPGIFLIIIATT